ncbi:MAG: hypothetical protein WAV31_05970 [Candidatus Moraniibacteriota bacterium]
MMSKHSPLHEEDLHEDLIEKAVKRLHAHTVEDVAVTGRQDLGIV